MNVTILIFTNFVSSVEIMKVQAYLSLLAQQGIVLGNRNELRFLFFGYEKVNSCKAKKFAKKLSHFEILFALKQSAITSKNYDSHAFRMMNSEVGKSVRYHFVKTPVAMSS